MALEIAFLVLCAGLGFIAAGTLFGLILSLLDRRRGAIVIAVLALGVLCVVLYILMPDIARTIHVIRANI